MNLQAAAAPAVAQRSLVPANRSLPIGFITGIRGFERLISRISKATSTTALLFCAVGMKHVRWMRSLTKCVVEIFYHFSELLRNSEPLYRLDLDILGTSEQQHKRVTTQ
ncbi:unnamed protein product [Gongylonema pulchrum]|uniref:Secreted protein n=1 Tax=Gongylonema pulchrum TaxID=637853 RepID=A0A183E7G0_9BILA|nr:unnamed protein product [Gongylonema pulchrum]